MSKRERFTTPPGTARYAWLKDPDIMFSPSGVFRTQLLVPKDNAKSLTQKLDELSGKALLKAQKENPGKKIILNEPYSHDVDEAGNPTDDVVFKFKKNATFSKPDGTLVKVAIPVFDAKGNKLKNVPPIYTGSTLRVCFSPFPYYVAAHRAAGVGLWIDSVQLIKLVTYANDAEYFGFEPTDGYVAEEKASTPQETMGEEFSEYGNAEVERAVQLRSQLGELCELIAKAEKKTDHEVLFQLTKERFGGLVKIQSVPARDLQGFIDIANLRLANLPTANRSIAEQP